MIKSHCPVIVEHNQFTKDLYRFVQIKIRYLEKCKTVPIDDRLGLLEHYHKMIDLCESPIKSGCRILGIDSNDLIEQSKAGLL